MRPNPRLTDPEDTGGACNLVNEAFDVELSDRDDAISLAQTGAVPRTLAEQLPQAGQPKDELEALHPERNLFFAGKMVTVRPYSGIEWLRLLPATRPLVDAMAALLADGREPTYEDALAAIAANIDALLPVVAQATDLDAADLESLDTDSFELLLMTWWGGNGGFFISRAINQVAVARHERRRGKSSKRPPRT